MGEKVLYKQNYFLTHVNVHLHVTSHFGNYNIKKKKNHCAYNSYNKYLYLSRVNALVHNKKKYKYFLILLLKQHLLLEKYECTYIGVLLHFNMYAYL